MTDHKIKLRPWITPNFATIERPPRSRQEGFSQDGASIPLSELEAETLSAMCDEFRAEVFRKAGKRDPRNP